MNCIMNYIVLIPSVCFTYVSFSYMYKYYNYVDTFTVSLISQFPIYYITRLSVLFCHKVTCHSIVPGTYMRVKKICVITQHTC